MHFIRRIESGKTKPVWQIVLSNGEGYGTYSLINCRTQVIKVFKTKKDAQNWINYRL